MNTEIDVAGYHIGDRVLAVKSDHYVLGKITNIDISEKDIRLTTPAAVLMPGAIIANITTSGVSTAKQVLENAIESRHQVFLSFCKSCETFWLALDGKARDCRCAAFHKQLDELAQYHALLKKLENYERGQKG